MKEKREPLWRRYARFLRPDVASDVDDELELHLALRANEFERRGMSPGDARRAAVSRFGDVNQVTQWLHSHDHAQQRTKRRQETLSMVMQHLRFATRSLLKQPAFSAAAIVTLAFGIGATAAVFAVVNGVLLKPLPYSEPEQLVTVKHTSPALATGTSVGQSHGTYETYRRLSRLTASSGLQETISLSITDGVTPERVQADSVTSGVLTTLRVPALLGRVFNENDERPGHIAVAIISEGFWRRRFVGDPAVIGRSLQIDGRAHEIVGVLPSHMRYPNEGVVLWLPLELSDADPVPGSLRYESVSRLRPGVTREAAEREYSKLAPRGSDFFSVAAPGISMAKWLE
ncbi:MAG: ABC transporter permease, partial [Gemmatimonadaceae bacterium]